jgi:F0F1-type ATP synthase membrane subunit b/b'
MSELLREALREVTRDPLAFAAEIVQFAVLVVIVWQLARRFVAQPLAERRRRVTEEVEQADAAPRLRAEADARAAALLAEGRAEAARIAERAAAAADAARRDGRERIEREAAGAVVTAEQALGAEKDRAAREASDRLVELIGTVVRRFLETLPEGERRVLTQRLILDRLKEVAG